MTNSSATGGYLVPAPSPAPLEGQDFNRFLQQIVVGITGMEGNLVRPRWQPEPPNWPAVGSDWAALGIIGRKADTFAVELHDPNGDGSSELRRHEEVELLVSFYGPNADLNAELLRDGLQISQNREVMQLASMNLVETGECLAVPSLEKDKWLYRVDLRVVIRRQIRRVYPVLNLLSANGTLNTDEPLQSVSINTP